MASVFIQYALARGEGFVKKSICFVHLKIVDHPLSCAYRNFKQECVLLEYKLNQSIKHVLHAIYILPLFTCTKLKCE